MLLVYTFVFSVIFKAKWPDVDETKTQFALVLFAGMLIYTLFAECATRAPVLISQNVNYVKKIVFPLEILPLVALGTALFHAFISILVWFIFFIFINGIPPITALQLPLLFFPLCCFIMGLSWILASLGVFLRDIGHVVGVMVTTLLFLSPIFYPISAIPEKYHFLINCNPLAFIIEQARGLLIFGVSFDFLKVAVLTFCMLLFAWFGFVWFQKTRRGFSDVL